MRIRRCLIGAMTGLISALVFSSVASAEVTQVTIQSSVTPTKAPKKRFVGASDYFASQDAHAGDLPCALGTATTPACYAFPPSVNSLITFPSGLKFTPGNLPDCNLASLVGKGTAAARATCPRSVVSTGSNIQAFSDGRTITGTVTGFNGAPSGGNPSLYLHVDLPGVESKPILNGVIRGNTITFQVPPVPGSVIEKIDNTITKQVVGKKKNKKTGKVEKKFYLSFACKQKNYTVSETVTYANGKVLTGTTPGRCKQTK